MNSTPESAAQEGRTKSAALVLALGVAGFVVAGILSLILPSGTLVFFIGTNRVSLGALLLAAASVIALGLVAVDLARDVAAGRRLSLVPAVVLPVSLLLAYLALTLDFGLSYVETPQWGGLMLTMVIAVVGIVASLPLGILLALGRRSDMPVIRTFCIVFIEFWRGVPLITVLFHGQRDAAALPSRRRQFRQAHARPDRCHLVLGSLYGGSHPRRPAGHPGRSI